MGAVTDKQPYVNDISDIEIHLDDDDHVILRLLGPRGWIRCRIQTELLVDALAQVESAIRRSIDDQLREQP